jgi:phosphatidylinositol glycan class W
VLAQNFEVIGIFMVADLLVPPKPILVLEVFNHNLLPTFLLANLLTGLVNMSMHTIFVSSSKAFATLLAYLAALVGMMALAEAKKLRLKFW